ncbi:major facilitator superfamily transporter [Ceratobasidium sp. AG-Ba]|nr:major facilitator superfamily transporter [Ceratobasidium sp. AG-Ba]
MQLSYKQILHSFLHLSSLLLIWAVVYGLLDVSRKDFESILGLSRPRSAVIQTCFFGIGYIGFLPIAEGVVKRKGHERTTLMGLAILSIGSLPLLSYALFTFQDQTIFVGFATCTGVIAAGVTLFEEGSSGHLYHLPNIVSPGGPISGRINQTLSSLGVIAGPVLAAQFIFADESPENLADVQWASLSRFMFRLALAAVFLASDLHDVPETTHEVTAQIDNLVDTSSEPGGSFLQKYRLWFGWVCQTLYVGTQVVSFSCFINSGVEVVGWSGAKTSTYFFYAFLLFLGGRIFAIGLLMLWPVELVVGIWGASCAALICCAILLYGTSGLACLMVLFFFQGPLAPCVYAVSTNNIGRHARWAPSIMISAVAGGVIFPPVHGAIANSYGIRVSWAAFIPVYIYMATFGIILWYLDGRRVPMKSQGEAFLLVESGSNDAERKQLTLMGSPYEETRPL